MRVIAGSARGIRLAEVPAGTRPLADRAREGLFSSLGPDRVEGAVVLDLFAGTGAIGIEALSRGAASALFVDSAPAAVRVIAENLRRARLAARATVRRQDAAKAVLRALGRFDLIFMDPPYLTPPAVLDRLLADMEAKGIVAAGALVVLTRSTRSYTPVIPIQWRADRRLSYGDAVILAFQA